MHRRMTKSSLILLFAITQLFFYSCAGLKDVPESEKKYVEGMVVEGGVYGVRVKDDNQNILRFITRSGVVYQPADLHAYYGDRIGVTYYSVKKSSGDRHMALAIKMIKTNPNRLNPGDGTVNGIIRAAGMMRTLVHLPEKDLTVAFYGKGSATGWRPKVGDPVKMHYTEDAKRFYRKFKSLQIDRMGEGPVAIQNKIDTGVVTEILTQREIHQRPDRFGFKLDNGSIINMYVGAQTRLIPEDLQIEPGAAYTIEYYALLMGDQRLRHLATQINR